MPISADYKYNQHHECAKTMDHISYLRSWPRIRIKSLFHKLHKYWTELYSVAGPVGHRAKLQINLKSILKAYHLCVWLQDNKTGINSLS